MENNQKLKTLEHMVSIGFCQPKFYKRSIWIKVNKLMEFICQRTEYVKPHNFGRGKGKYITVNLPAGLNNKEEILCIALFGLDYEGPLLSN